MNDSNLKQLQTNDPKIHEFYLAQARVFRGKSNWHEMMKPCQNVLKEQPNNVEAKLLLGEALLNLEEWSQVIELHKEILAISPDNSFAYHRIAVALARLGKLTEADSYYEKVFDHEADFDKIHANNFLVQRQTGDFFFRKRNWLRSVEAYQRAIQLSPKSCWEYINLGRSFFKLGKDAEAVAVLEKAILVNEHHVWTHCYLAEILFEQGALELAAESCRRVLHLEPSNSEAKVLMAKIDSRMPSSQLDASFDQLPEKLAGILPGWEEDYEAGKRLQAQGQFKDAVELYYQSLLKNPHHSWSYHDLGDTFLNLGDWNSAIASYKQAIQLNSDYFWSNYNLGVAYRNIEAWENAVQLYQRSIHLNPALGLPTQILEETLRAWYDSLLQKGNSLLADNKKKSLECFREAVHIYQSNIHIPKFDISENVARSQQRNFRILMVVDDHLPQCLRYRVRQRIEQLDYAGFTNEYHSWTNAKEARNRLPFFNVVIFYRVPALPDVIQLIKLSKVLGKLVFYEIDDLIFDSILFPEPIESYGGQVTQEQYNGLIQGTVLFREAMKLCDFGIASTPSLQQQMKKVMGIDNCFLHRNALDSKNLQALAINSPKIERSYISIFYGSGTKAHNSDFDELVAPALAKVLQLHSNVRLTLMGHLTVPKILEPFQEQIDRIAIVEDVVVYYEFLKQADIAIAVLYPTKVNNCKSELKWFEAATFKVPCVVSNTTTYLEIIKQEEDGLIASNPDEWFEHLDSLVKNPILRKRIGESAHRRVMQKYSISVMADNFRDIIERIVESRQGQERLVLQSSRKKLLIVNVFYPPQSIGGATRIVKDNVDILTTEYNDIYEVSIFTTEEGNQEPYQLSQYSHKGVRVTRVSSPMEEGMDWRYKNPTMYDIFKEYLEVYQPDLIHFHCVQRLTASVLEVAADMNIPFLVTAHDAWWISDHQFLVNSDGEECNYQQNDPVITARDTHNVTESIQRKLYLREQLNRAAAVLAVSEAFAKIYRKNGFPQTKANPNGIMPRPQLPRQLNPNGRIRFAHVGGMSAHKGYYLFKQAVEAANLENSEVVVVDHAKTVGSASRTQWGTTPVTVMAKVDQDKMPGFYSTIDILVAPSLWPESFGLVTREAVAAGVWVIASNKGALAEELVDGENGYVVSVENTEALLRILQTIDREPSSFKSCTNLSALPRLTQHQVEELVQFYKEI
ncbi:MAG: glycosyltransferase [Cyanothece sp. SIO2G6]|nr:glycosyltransferase [Cyanothece sp. SIO2G6]